MIPCDLTVPCAFNMPALLALLLFLLAPLASDAQANEPFHFDSTPGKLPKDVVPLAYRISLTPDLGKERFAGHVSIDLEVRKATKRIVLNAADLSIRSASLSGVRRRPLHLAVQIRAADELLQLNSAAALAPGHYVLDMDYQGQVNRSPNGLYADHYQSANGARVLLATQLESTDARRVFPCWDEPAFRASFQLSAVLPATFSAYSNTPIERREQLPDGLQRVRFAATPRMASYLVALAAGDFERISQRSGKVEVGVVFTQGKRAGAEYPLQSASELLGFYNDYFGQPFPLPKLDNIAVPGGFQGAMENWGAIIYNEAALLHDPASSPESAKRRVYEVVAHEMAHQWFGDLVTTAWWDDLWLNEGFASWMGSKATDHFNPQWHVWLHASGEREHAMELDARGSTHPIQQVIHNETEAADAFDEITYLKGQSFLRMLEVYLSEADFRSGIRAYLTAHRYSSATTADLWQALGAASGKPVARLAADWTQSPGFPVLSVTARCEGAQTLLQLSQQRFRSDDQPAGTQRWIIPVGVALGGEPTRYVLLEQEHQSFRFDGCATPLVIDPDGVGYFRTQYAPDLRAALLDRVTELNATTRLKLVADSWGLFAANRQSLADYLDLLPRLQQEPERATWDEILGRLRTLRTLVSDQADVREHLGERVRPLLQSRFNTLGWVPRSGESSEDAELRSDLIRALGRFDDPQVVSQAQERLQDFLRSPDALAPGLRDAVLAVAGEHADSATYDALLGRARSALGTEEAMRYYHALAVARDPALAQRTLELALRPDTPELIATQLPVAVAASGHLDLAWQYTLGHWDALAKRMSPFDRPGYFGAVLSDAADATLAADLLHQGSTRLPADARTEVERAADRILVAARLKARVLGNLAP